MPHARTPVAHARRPAPEASRPTPNAPRPTPLAPRPVPDTTHDGRRLLIYTTPPTARRLRTRLHARTPSDTATRVILARGVAYRRDDPSSKTGSHRAAHHPHTGTRLPHASVAHFDVLYFNFSVAGVPLFKADPVQWSGDRGREA